MSALTPEDIAALKAQGYHFRATADGEVRFTPQERLALIAVAVLLAALAALQANPAPWPLAPARTPARER